MGNLQPTAYVAYQGSRCGPCQKLGMGDRGRLT